MVKGPGVLSELQFESKGLNRFEKFYSVLIRSMLTPRIRIMARTGTIFIKRRVFLMRFFIRIHVMRNSLVNFIYLFKFSPYMQGMCIRNASTGMNIKL
jgi:hypothetical protein